MLNSRTNRFLSITIPDPKFRMRCLFVLAILLSLFRIWLLIRANWMPLENSYYDDYLQVRQAVSIVAGDWLGDGYDKFVMAKNPGFPLFLAGCYFLRIPYPVALGLLMCGAAAYFCYSIRKLIDHKWVLFLLYAIIIFSPFHPEAYLRIYRNALVPWVSLFVIASMITIYFSERSIKYNILQAVIGMSMLGLFWILREDSMWLVPLLLFFIILTGVKILKSSEKRKVLMEKGIPIAIVILGIPLSVTFVSSINNHYYGIYAMNDRTETNITTVMSDLYKIDDGNNENDTDIWLSYASLNKAIENSPSLSEIDFKKDYENWAGGPEKDLKGDHVEWALRDAMTNHGYYQDAQETNDYYLKIHNELQTAFDKGDLQVEDGISISRYVNPLRSSDFSESFFMSFEALNAMGHYNLCDSDYREINYMDGALEGDLEVWENIAGIEIPKNAEQINIIADRDVALWDNAVIERSIRRSAHITYIINRFYIIVSHILFPLSIIVMIVLLIVALIKLFRRDKDQNDMWKIMFGLGLGGMTDLYAVTLFSRWISKDVYSKVWPFYASSVNLYITIFMALGGIWLIEFLWRRFFRKGVASK